MTKATKDEDAVPLKVAPGAAAEDARLGTLPRTGRTSPPRAGVAEVTHTAGEEEEEALQETLRADHKEAPWQEAREPRTGTRRPPYTPY